MKRTIPPHFFSVFLLIILGISACKKEQITTSSDAELASSTDLLAFDTVFTASGSVTRQFRLINTNDQRLRIAKLQLAGGANSPFSLNVNGQPGTSFTGLTLDAGDSLYVFVRVNINPNNSRQPFIESDSVLIDFNGNTKKVFLEAYGQNARYISAGTITGNTSWNAGLPYVITGPLTIAADVTLTLLPGTRVFCRATAPILVNGSLRALGEFYDSTRIIFKSDRLDEPYNELPGGWPGIVFGNTSKNNLLLYTELLNAYQAIIVNGGITQTPAKLILDHAVIDNAYDLGLFAFNASVDALNCRFTQIGNDGNAGAGGSNIIISGGGIYRFSHCTIATFANFYQNHKQPALYLTNAAGSTAASLRFAMDNSIIYGQSGFTEDEVVTRNVPGATFEVNFNNVLFKAKTDPAGLQTVTSLRNINPEFDSINTNLRRYNFRLRPTSPAVDFGAATNIARDLDGLPRVMGSKPDLGAYEKQ